MCVLYVVRRMIDHRVLDLFLFLFFFVRRLGFLISEIDFVFFFLDSIFEYYVGRGIFIDSVSLSPFFFFFLFLDADRIFIDFVLFISIFFFVIAEFLQFYMFGGEN